MREPADEVREFWAVPMDRRRFLARGAAGVLWMSAGGVLSSGCRGYPQPEVALRFFNSTEYTVVNTLAEHVLGVPGRIGAGAGQIDVAAHVDTIVAGWNADAQGELRTMLRIFEHGTYLFDLQRKRFTRLRAGQQAGYVDGWMHSTLGARRIAFRVLKALAANGYYQDPRTWRRLAYDGPWLGRVHATPRTEPEAAVPLRTLPGMS